MKKLWIIIGTISITLMVIVLLIVFVPKSQALDYTSFPKNYNYLENDGDIEIEFPIFYSEKENILIQKENVNDSLLTSKDESIIVPLNIESITYQEAIVLKEKTFYKYLYKFTFKAKELNDHTILIPDAYLKIIYKDTKALKFHLGSFSYYQEESFNTSNNDLRITYLKGIVNEINGEKRVVAIDLKIANNTNKTLVLNSMNIYDQNINVSHSLIKEVDYDLASNELISNVIANYSYREIDTSSYSLELEPYEEKHLVIPLGYKDDVVVNEFAFRISYLKDEEENSYYLGKFLFFEETRYTENELAKMIVYRYDHSS